METFLSKLQKKPEAKKYVPLKITTANNNPEPHIAKTTDPPDGSTDKPLTVKEAYYDDDDKDDEEAFIQRPKRLPSATPNPKTPDREHEPVVMLDYRKKLKVSRTGLLAKLGERNPALKNLLKGKEPDPDPEPAEGSESEPEKTRNVAPLVIEYVPTDTND
jgi:hypothetical protein